jgi:hypothetical protein
MRYSFVVEANKNLPARRNKMEAVVWQKWIGEYQDQLGAESKVHGWEQLDDGSEGNVPSYQDGYSVFSINWRCKKIIATRRRKPLKPARRNTHGNNHQESSSPNQ